MLNKKTNHTHKEELGCVPGPHLKRYKKTSKLAQKYNTRHTFYQSKLNRHLDTQGWNQI